MNEPSSSIPTMRAAMRRCRGELMSTAVFSLFINLLMLTFPLYMLQIFTRVLANLSGTSGTSARCGPEVPLRFAGRSICTR